MIHLPESVTVVSLSATVSNAEEFGEWLETVRGETDDDRRGAPAGPALPARDGREADARPVRLLRRRRGGRLRQGGRPGQRRADEDRPRRLGQHPPDARPSLAPQGQAGSSKAKFSKDGRNVGNGRRVWIPSRADVVDRLDREGLLPAIVFIFSRVGCDAAVQQCLNAGVRLTSPEERDTIHEYVEAARQDLPDEDLHVLGYHDFLEGLTRGIAAHHAGMLPAFKHIVEELYVRGPVQGGLRDRDPGAGHQHAGPHRGHREAHEVERRRPRRHHAGGVHPAHRPGRPPRPRRRGSRRRALAARHEPARGGRPGLDPYLPAPLVLPPVVQHGGQPGRTSTAARPRASCWSSPSRSSRPTRPWSGWPGSCARRRRRSRGTPSPRAASWGDFMEYAGLRRRISDVEKGASKARRADRRDGGDRVAAPAQARRRHRGADRQVRRVRRRHRPQLGRRQPAARTSSPPTVRPAGSRSSTSPCPWRRWPASRSRSRSTAGTRRCAATWPRRCGPAPTTWRPRRRARRRAAEGRPDSAAEREIEELRTTLRAHPCHACPDREEHDRWAQRWFKLDRDAATLRRRVETRTNTVARQFDRVCEVLTALGYLAERRGRGPGHRPGPPPDAPLLRARPGRGRVPAHRPLGRARPCPSWPQRSRCWSSRRGDPTTPHRRGSPAAGSAT